MDAFAIEILVISCLICLAIGFCAGYIAGLAAFSQKERAGKKKDEWDGLA